MPGKGASAPDFKLTTKELKDVGLADFAGKRKVLNIVPSLDTPTCAKSTRVFNEKASAMNNTVVLVISADLPFAMSRFCSAEGLNNVVTLSTFRDREFPRQVRCRCRRWSAQGLDRARRGGAGREQQGARTPSWCPKSPMSPTTMRRWLRSSSDAVRSVTSSARLAHRPQACADNRLVSRADLRAVAAGPGRAARTFHRRSSRVPEIPAELLRDASRLCCRRCPSSTPCATTRVCRNGIFPSTRTSIRWVRAR